MAARLPDDKVMPLHQLEIDSCVGVSTAAKVVVHGMAAGRRRSKLHPKPTVASRRLLGRIIPRRLRLSVIQISSSSIPDRNFSHVTFRGNVM
jgi:hypothetical protein